MLIRILGIDPGVRTGAAVVDLDGDLLFHRLIHEAADLNDIMEDIVALGVTHAYIEDQFVGVNKMGAIKLAHRAGIWHGLCIANSIEVTTVPPQTWQCAELGCGARTPRKERKAMAISKCKGLWSVDLKTDVADAALIARYGAMQIAANERLRRLKK